MNKKHFNTKVIHEGQKPEEPFGAVSLPIYQTSTFKQNEFGEYIFDHVWADAYHRYGLNYYPKLQSAIPFTPVTGERIIIKNTINNKISKKIKIINRIISEAKKINVSSLHFNFLINPLTIKKRMIIF